MVNGEWLVDTYGWAVYCPLKCKCIRETARGFIWFIQHYSTHHCISHPSSFILFLPLALKYLGVRLLDYGLCGILAGQFRAENWNWPADFARTRTLYVSVSPGCSTITGLKLTV